MTYDELEISAEIKLREKGDGERAPSRLVRYAVVAKYPNMCIVEDRKGRRRGVAVGELIVNKIIKQDPVLESLRKESNGTRKTSRGWRKKGSECTAEYAPYKTWSGACFGMHVLCDAVNDEKCLLNK